MLATGRPLVLVVMMRAGLAHGFHFLQQRRA